MGRIGSVTNVGKFEISVGENEGPELKVKKGRSSRSLSYPYNKEKIVTQGNELYPSYNSDGECYVQKVFDAEDVKFFLYPIMNQELSENIPLGKKDGENVRGGKFSANEVGIVTFVNEAGSFFDLNLVASAIGPKDHLNELIKSLGASRIFNKKVQKDISEEDIWGWGLIKFKPRDTPF